MKQQTKRRKSYIQESTPPQAPEVETLPDAAGFWRRLTGFVVDIFLCFGIPSVASSLVLLEIGYSARSAAVDTIWMLGLAVIVMVYFTIFSRRGQSPGMRVAGIKVVDVHTGEAPNLSRALIRASLLLLLIASWFILILLGSARGSVAMSNAAAVLLNIDYVVFLASFFGHLWIAWDKKRQTLQDKVAGVVVVRETATVEPVQPVQRKSRRKTIDPLEWRM